MHTLIDKKLEGTLLPRLITLYLFMTIRKRLQLQEKKRRVYALNNIETGRDRLKSGVKGNLSQRLLQETGQI